jgi:hypothetical protein
VAKISVLVKFNLEPGFIYETIVTTFRKENIPNAAPMGINFIDAQKLIISPFLATQTFKNIEGNGCAVINFTHDLNLFFESVFSKKIPKLPREFFERATQVNAPRLKSAIAHIEVRTNEITKEGNRSIITGDIVTWDLSSIPFFPINRGYNLVLESIIHTTRILAFQNDTQKVTSLMNLVNQYHTLIKKVAPTGIYGEIMNKLQKIIEKR